MNGQYDKDGNVIEPIDLSILPKPDPVPLVSIDDELDGIGDDTDDILEDTSAIDNRTKSIDKKLLIIIALWGLDKLIILLMFLLFNKII